MILFMAMPFVMGLMNLVVPLQIGARDVAYPFLNALSFWLFFVDNVIQHRFRNWWFSRRWVDFLLPNGRYRVYFGRRK